ncbi:MAG: efflux RND transporter periplasmic adaptor subunit [Chromatiaceae bacterium]|nr:efflux RND transporter periplasmic adaptor subunit [Chromatiaceae bacterium]
MPSKPFTHPPFWLIAISLLVAGCGQGEGPAPLDAAASAPSVEVMAAVKKPIEQQVTFVGRVAAVDKVELRARVEGFLKERRFIEGQPVRVDEVLFLIEPDQYQAIVQEREADLAKAQAEVENTRAQFARGEELLRQKNMSAAEVDKLRAANRVAAAGVEQAQAALAVAQLNLDYTQIKAPVAGRIGRAALTVGNLVGPASGVLATLVSQDPMHILFPVTQRELLDARQRAAANGGEAKELTVRARLPDGSLYDQAGRLDFVDVITNSGTDTVLVRAVFPNPEGLLSDGQYLSVLLAEEEPESAILIPQASQQVDQQGVYVLVLDGDQKVQVRRIQTGPMQGSNSVVLSGLKEGELVVTEGIQKVRPGQIVTATPADAPGAPAAEPGQGDNP